MRRRAAAGAAALLLGLAAAGCGGGDDGAPAPASSGATTTQDAGTITSFDGAVCSARPPDQPAAPKTYDAPPPLTIDRSATYRATIATSCGDIVVRLDPKAAPRTVNSFVFLAREGFYDGSTFHRVVRNYIIQGGAPTPEGLGGPGYTLPDELSDDGYPLGSVAMANRGPGTSGSQFFIVTGDASFLTNAYSRFGRVVRGLDVARTIEGFADPAAPPGDPAASAPSETIWIYSVRISEE